jgi:hypothetical protein
MFVALYNTRRRGLSMPTICGHDQPLQGTCSMRCTSPDILQSCRCSLTLLLLVQHDTAMLALVVTHQRRTERPLTVRRLLPCSMRGSCSLCGTERYCSAAQCPLLAQRAALVWLQAALVWLHACISACERTISYHISLLLLGPVRQLVERVLG